MAQYDIESVLGDIKTFLLANLNTQISALNTEKNDGITLKTVNSGAYHLQFLEDRVDLADPTLLYGESDEPIVNSIGPGTAITYFVGVWLVLADSGADPTIVTRLFRYRRALKDVFKAYWDAFAKEHKMKITMSSPTPAFKDMETGYSGRLIGVKISLTIVE